MNWSDLKVGDILIQPDVDANPWHSAIQGSIFIMLENNLPCELGKGLQNMRVFHIADSRETVWTVAGTITSGYKVLRGTELILEGL